MDLVSFRFYIFFALGLVVYFMMPAKRQWMLLLVNSLIFCLSKDDVERNAMYKANAARSKLQDSFADYGAYLLFLEMEAEIRPFEELYEQRIAQLTNKSNQFNLTTRRYTQAQVHLAAQSAELITLYGKLRDRFGDNGIVSVVIGEIRGDALL